MSCAIAQDDHEGRTYRELCDKLAFVDVRVGTTDTAEGDYMRTTLAIGCGRAMKAWNAPFSRRSSSPHFGMGTSRMSNL